MRHPVQFPSMIVALFIAPAFVMGAERLPMVDVEGESSVEQQEAAPQEENSPRQDSELNMPELELGQLGGDWLLTLPAGFQYRISLEALQDGRYQLQHGSNFAGIYEVRGDKLFMSEPVDERHDVFTWRILNANTLLLIDETGASCALYAGATLGRQIDPETELPRTVTTIAAPAFRRDRSEPPADPARETEQ